MFLLKGRNMTKRFSLTIFIFMFASLLALGQEPTVQTLLRLDSTSTEIRRMTSEIDILFSPGGDQQTLRPSLDWQTSTEHLCSPCGDAGKPGANGSHESCGRY